MPELLTVGWADCRVGTTSKFVDLRGQYLPSAWRIRSADTKHSCPLAFGRKVDADRTLAALQRQGIHDTQQFNTLTRDELMRIVGEAMAW